MTEQPFEAGRYAGGFAQGEADAFYDRRRGVSREMREAPVTAEERGYWDAYSPRSATWGAMVSTPKRVVTVDELAA